MYVCPVVCINIYFAPNVPKVWGLHSRLQQAPATLLHHLTFAMLGHRQQSFTMAITEHHFASAMFSTLKVFCCRRLIRLIICSLSTRGAPLSSPEPFLTGPSSSFQNSTLCKAPVRVSPFHPDDCNKRQQMKNFD